MVKMHSVSYSFDQHELNPLSVPSLLPPLARNKNLHSLQAESSTQLVV